MAQSAESLGAVRQALGLSSDVPDSDVKLLMKTQMGQNALKKVAAQPSGGPGFIQSGLEALKQHWETSEKPIDTLIQGLEGKPKEAPPAKKETKAKTTDTAKLPSAAEADQSPFTQLAQQLAQTYLQQVNQLQSLTSGAQTPGLESEAQGAAQADLKGLTGGLPASVQQAEAAAIPANPSVPLAGNVAQAQQALGNAQSAGALGMAGAIGATGPAEAATLSAAPWSTLLNELISESAYRASSPSGGGPAALGLTSVNTPSWLQGVLKDIGIPVSSPTGATTTGSSGLTVPSKAASSTGSVPSSGGNPGAP